MYSMLGIPSEHSRHLIEMNVIRTSEDSTAAAAVKAYE
jgi:hypothetical protein